MLPTNNFKFEARLSMKIIGIGGLPASGKSYTVQGLMANLSKMHGREWTPKAYGMAMYEQLGDRFVMGRYSGVAEYAGTDRLSMNCYRAVKMFWKALAKNVPEAVVIFEGNRLFKDDMLTFANAIADTSWIVLDAGEEITHQRHVERRDTQTERILKARQTELSNLLQRRGDIRVVSNRDESESQALLFDLLWQCTEGD